MIKENKRYIFIDLLKCIAIYFVILLHLFPVNDIIYNPSLDIYISYIIRLFIEGVPIFLIVNGYLLINKPLDNKKHFKKILKMILLILIWQAIYTMVISRIEGDDITKIEFIESIFNNYYCGVLLFLKRLVAVYLIFPILKYLYDNNEKLYNYLFIITAIFTIGLNFINLGFNFVIYLNSDFKIIINSINDFMHELNIFNLDYYYYLYYFMLGALIFRYENKLMKNLKKISILSIISIVFIILYAIIGSLARKWTFQNNYAYYTIFYSIVLIDLFLLFSKIKYNNRILISIIKLIGKNTLGIFIIHQIIQIIISKNYTPIYTYQYLILSLIILIISLILTILFKKIPIIRKLFTM